MDNFTFEELRMIRFALLTEIICRENNRDSGKNVDLGILKQFNELLDKVDSMIQNIRGMI